MSTIPIISFRLRIMVSLPAFFMSKTSLLHINFSFINRVLLVFSSIILLIVIPVILSTNGALTFTSFVHQASVSVSFSGYMGTDCSEIQILQSLAFITPSNSNTFFIPKTKSTFSCISDTRYRSQTCVHALL